MLVGFLSIKGNHEAAKPWLAVYKKGISLPKATVKRTTHTYRENLVKGRALHTREVHVKKDLTSQVLRLWTLIIF